jgi:hypothetical protein
MTLLQYHPPVHMIDIYQLGTTGSGRASFSISETWKPLSRVRALQPVTSSPVIDGAASVRSEKSTLKLYRSSHGSAAGARHLIILLLLLRMEYSAPLFPHLRVGKCSINSWSDTTADHAWAANPETAELQPLNNRHRHQSFPNQPPTSSSSPFPA